VFNRRGDDMLFVSARCLDDAEDGVIVGFRAAAGEDDFLGARSDQCSDGLASGFHRCAGPLSEGMDGSGIAELGRQIGQHGVEDFRLDGGGGVVVEVDALHESVAFRIDPAESKGKGVGPVKGTASRRE
jgi:hypothetical protein